MSAPIKVQIFGQVYSIQGELDGKYVQRLAKYVDEKMHDIADVTKTVDTQKVAVLAALAIADELHNIQRDRGDHEQLMREQAERCLTLVERDFSLLLADGTKFSDVTKTIQSLGIKEISAVEATDLFRGKNVPAGKYSLLVRVTFQSREATLTEAQIGDFSGKIISALEKNLGAILRAS